MRPRTVSGFDREFLTKQSKNAMTACEPVERISVVMLYDHFPSIGVAMSTYSHLVHDLESEVTPELRVWRVDEAIAAEFSAEADGDIAAADVIILAVRGDQPFPAAFAHWKDGPGSARGTAPHAIIVLIDTAEQAHDADWDWNLALRSAATQIHPEVFVCEENAALAGQHS